MESSDLTTIHTKISRGYIFRIDKLYKKIDVSCTLLNIEYCQEISVDNKI